MKNSEDKKYALGMIGLGTMGRNLLLNMADKGFNVTGYDKSEEQVALLKKEGLKTDTTGTANIKEFVNSLKTPRTIMMLVPAGKIVDAVIQELLPLLDEGDLIVDGGNSHYTDTDKRFLELQKKKIHFFGMGISGGEKGARFGPSMMPGGDKKAYKVMKPILEAVSAKVDGEPCVTYIGPGASGHFVKMVHNGIEYALMQMIAEAYELMKVGLAMPDKEIGAEFKKWNNGKLQSYLLEITSEIFNIKEDGDKDILLNYIKDEAKAKGTGKWTSQASMDLQSVTTCIDAAVAMRDLSKQKDLRLAVDAVYKDATKIDIDKREVLKDLEDAASFTMKVIYTQGMELMQKASQEMGYDLNLADCAKIWRGGCIIRAAFLEEIYEAYQNNADLENLLLDKKVSNQIKSTVNAARSIIIAAVKAGIGTTVFSSALSYFDNLKTGRMPSNLIQAQRDYFGAHTYERIDKEGIFHTQWQTES
ncbi:NADP-dependent phosphogluconate dehydrogenase [Pedobacter sp. SD-b]|uniref:6-phosphogluconate dehydrogenase, decarboxylating n=1 Tax=Pedobacter segetis TaxID=2793069 RepID=A0ABS1BFH9_9SPHI|nr:NADP-dependent phosphogluconate dehydrogenase [Pedobacter segetis]MBK0381576.1 NADP-dependent phosphogluconate dehydrogenase [Pedobacter segetis]